MCAHPACYVMLTAHVCAQVHRLGGTTLPALLITLLVAMGVLLWQHMGDTSSGGDAGAGGAGKAKSRKLRSTEYVD